MDIRVYAVKNKESRFVETFTHNMPPRANEFFSFHHYHLKITEIIWIVDEQEILVDVYADGSNIDDETWSRL